MLPGQDPRDLHDVVQVVRHPRRQQLPQRHDAELGVAAAPIQIGPGHAERRQLPQVVLAQRRELVEQAGERASFRERGLREAIERVERPRLALLRMIRARGTQSVCSP